MIPICFVVGCDGGAMAVMYLPQVIGVNMAGVARKNMKRARASLIG